MGDYDPHGTRVYIVSPEATQTTERKRKEVICYMSYFVYNFISYLSVLFEYYGYLLWVLKLST